MTFRLEIAEAAEQDAREAFLWYCDKSPHLADKFEIALEDGMSKLKQNPFKYQVRYSSIRIKFLSHFPFGIHFKVSGELIIVIGVMHTYRSPSRWLGRL